LHDVDLPAKPLFAVSLLIAFVWSFSQSGDILSAAAVSILTAWLVVIPVALSYTLLFLTALTLLTVIEWIQGAVSTLSRLIAKVRHTAC
jgi:hypothetical protein